jgi:hypothetical protein
LCTKEITCDKAGFKSRFCQVLKAGKKIISVNLVILSNFSSCSSCASWLKNPFNQRNLRLIKDLRLFKVLYICRDSSTDAERSLQIHPFLTNKPNFRKSQINVSDSITRNYENKTLGQLGKTNPIQTQFKPNSKPIQSQYKAKQTQIQKGQNEHNVLHNKGI